MIESYTRVKEIAEKWGLTSRTVQILCAEGKIKGVTKFSNQALKGITISRLDNVQKEELKEKMSTLRWILSRVPNVCIVEEKNILSICSLDNIDAYYQAFSVLDRCSEAPSEWIGRDLTQEKGLLSELESTIDAIGKMKEEIGQSYQESIFDIDPIPFLAN